MFIESNLKICAEILLEISHHLMSKTGKMEDIEKVYSHPHAIAQCRNWLDRNLPNIPIIDVASTALAAKSASDDHSVAAIASEYAASCYDLKIVKDEVGILYRMLEPFAKNNVNLTKIESRPLKKKAWEYMFFLDLEGHISDKNVKKALEELDKKSLFLKVLGSYPRSN
jgi:chorismate mutase/prephenate dehydratase